MRDVTVLSVRAQPLLELMRNHTTEQEGERVSAKDATTRRRRLRWWLTRESENDISQAGDSFPRDDQIRQDGEGGEVDLNKKSSKMSARLHLSSAVED